MIARKTNTEVRPAFCLQRHHCLRKNGKCPIRCSWWDFTPRTGDAHVRRNTEKAERA